MRLLSNRPFYIGFIIKDLGILVCIFMTMSTTILFPFLLDFNSRLTGFLVVLEELKNLIQECNVCCNKKGRFGFLGVRLNRQE